LQTITDILAAFPDGYKKNVIVSAADVNSGEYHAFTNFNTQYTDLPKAAMSSASIPAIFPPMEWNGSVYMDGGTVWNLNIDSAI
jgi:predicted acylesterase/phospholipase RssA